MKVLITSVLGMVMLASFAVAADETCYRVSKDGQAWSKTPENLCILDLGNNEYEITLRSGLTFNEREIAKFRLNLLQRARCSDCNADVYGVANPENSTFNALSIKFDGKFQRGPADGLAEAGTVSIGATKLYYRSNIR